MTDKELENILSDNLMDTVKEQWNENRKTRYKEELENKLALSNIRANELNEKNSKYNNIGLIINIVLGFINVSLLIWQIKSTE